MAYLHRKGATPFFLSLILPFQLFDLNIIAGDLSAGIIKQKYL